MQIKAGSERLWENSDIASRKSLMSIMIKKLHRTLLLASFLLLAGCPYISEMPLATPAETTLDERLVGRWMFNQGKYLEFAPATKQTYRYVVMERGEEQSRGYVNSVTIGDATFLNMRVINPNNDSVSAYMFIRYHIEGDAFTMQVVSDELPDGSYASPEALRGFIQENLNNRELYAKAEVLSRFVMVPQPQ